MRVKEIYVGISYLYEKKAYQFGKVEFSELISVDENENVEQIRGERFARLLDLSKTMVRDLREAEVSSTVLPNVPTPSPVSVTESPTSPPMRRRRPVVSPLVSKEPDDIQF